MSEVFDDIMGDGKDGGQSMKASEITGDRFPFHSLPKEFQDWHTTYFIMEQRAPLDSSVVSKAVLNGYMWKVIYDGTFYGVITAMFIIFSLIKLKLSPNIWGLLVSVAIYLPWMIYLIYHFKFYAFIHAQVVGPVTESGKFHTVDFFNATFGMVAGSLLVAASVVIAFLTDLADLLAKLVNEIDGKDHSSSFGAIGDDTTRSILVSVHNFIAQVLDGPDDLFGKILFNENIMGILFSAATMAGIVYFYKLWKAMHRETLEKDIKIAKIQSGYPIEAALDCLWEWREKHGQ